MFRFSVQIETEREKGMGCLNPFYLFNISICCCSIVCSEISGLFQVHQIGELYLMKILFISCCPLKMSLFLIFCMIYVCWTGSIFNSKVVRGVSRDTAICLQVFIPTSSSTQNCYYFNCFEDFALWYKRSKATQLYFQLYFC